MPISSLPFFPIEPMLAKTAEALPSGDGFLYEPKWDGLRAVIFGHGDSVQMQGRDGKLLNRYFPELEKLLIETLPKGCVVDGEIIVATPQGLDYDALQQRIDPAAARVARLAKETPAAFIAFDLLAAGARSTLAVPLAERRVRLERLLGHAKPPVYLTPTTRDPAQAQDWLQRFQGAGLDGVMAKSADSLYLPGKRVPWKVKHRHTADCVVAGFRWHQEPAQRRVGALLLGLYNAAGALQHVGFAASFAPEMRQQLADELEPLRQDAWADHPWRAWAEASATQGPDQRWEPLRLERVAEVGYERPHGHRFRDPTRFLRWRADKPVQACQEDQLEVTPAAELAQLFAAKPRRKA